MDSLAYFPDSVQAIDPCKFQEVTRAIMTAYRTDRIDAGQCLTLMLCFGQQFANRPTPAAKLELSRRWLKILATTQSSEELPL